MTQYNIYGLGPSLFNSNSGGSIAGRLLYVTPTGFGILNADGTKTYFHGTGFAFDSATDNFLPGALLQSVSHYSAAGAFIDGLSGLSAGWAYLSTLLRNPSQFHEIFNLDDVIDARYRAGNAVVNDTIKSGGGNDTVYAGSGNDMVNGGTGSDTLWGGTGNDRLTGGTDSVADFLYGEDGNDILNGRALDMLDGGAGIDTATFSDSFSQIGVTKTATGFNVGGQTLTNIERIATDEGTYEYSAITQQWTLINTRSGVELANPSIVKNLTAGNDTVYITDSVVKMVVYNGLAGDDSINLIYAKATDVYVYAGVGNDQVFVSAPDTTANTFVYGGDGNDTLVLASYDGSYSPTAIRHLFGEAGDDVLSGTRNADELSGGAGADKLTGSLGNDILSGGTGGDIFEYYNWRFAATPGLAAYDQGWGADVITDFQVGVDFLSVTGIEVPFTIQDTAAGLLITGQLLQSINNPPGAYAATILLQGVHGAYTMDDLLV